MELSVTVSIIASSAAFLLSAGTLVWIGGFRFSAVIHEIKTIKTDMQKMEVRLDAKIDKLETRMEKGFEKIDQRFEKIENRLDRIEDNFHKMDLRVNTLEQRKF